jgi:hypothetical protein
VKTNEPNRYASKIDRSAPSEVEKNKKQPQQAAGKDA